MSTTTTSSSTPLPATTSIADTSTPPVSSETTSLPSTITPTDSSSLVSTIDSSTSDSSTVSQTTESTTTAPSTTVFPTGANGTTNGTAHHTHSTVSNGAAAGIAVGTFFIGAAIALCGIWLFYHLSQRQRGYGSNKRQSHNRIPSSGRPVAAFGKLDAEAATGAEASVPLDTFSPVERADDSQIRKHMQDLEELIYQHVENHYHIRPYTGRPEDLAVLLARCGYGDSTTPSKQTLTSLLIAPDKRRTAIKHLIAWVILHGIDLNGELENSLLPDSVAVFYQTMRRGKPRTGANAQDAFNKYLTKWRQLSSHLLSSISAPSRASSYPEVARTSSLLNSILKPLAQPNSTAQSENLTSIIAEGRDLGMLLFAQPGKWVFGWEESFAQKRGSKMGTAFDGAATGSGIRRRDIVVFPGLGELVSRGRKESLRVVSDIVREDV